MNPIVVLIDLANTGVLRGIHRPNPEIIGARLDSFLSSLTEKVHLGLERDFSEFHVRLYDGWFAEDGRATDLHNMIRTHPRSIYPTRRRNYRIVVEVADAPMAAKGDRLLNTFRVRPGLGPRHVTLTAEPVAGCLKPNECAIAGLRTWINGNCSQLGCRVSTAEAACFREQKLVDTALVSDAVWIGSQGKYLVVVSDDEDVIPGLITARAYGTGVAWANRSERPRDPYTLLITKHRISHIPCW
jgi:hypothetical protein